MPRQGVEELSDVLGDVACCLAKNEFVLANRFEVAMRTADHTERWIAEMQCWRDEINPRNAEGLLLSVCLHRARRDTAFLRRHGGFVA